MHVGQVLEVIWNRINQDIAIEKLFLVPVVSMTQLSNQFACNAMTLAQLWPSERKEGYSLFLLLITHQLQGGTHWQSADLVSMATDPSLPSSSREGDTRQASLLEEGGQGSLCLTHKGTRSRSASPYGASEQPPLEAVREQEEEVVRLVVGARERRALSLLK